MWPALRTEVLGKLRAAGAHLVEADIPELAGLIELTTAQVQNHDVRTSLANYLSVVTMPEWVSRR